MRLSGIQLGFCVSLLVHGIVAAYAVTHRSPARPALPIEDAGTLEIILVSDADAKRAEPSVTAVTAAPPLPEPAPVQPEPARLETVEPQTIELQTVQPELLAVAEFEPTVATSEDLPVAPHGSAGILPAGRRDAGAPSSTVRPAYLVNPKPEYPREARRRQQQGIVILGVLVTEAGVVQRVEVRQSSNHALLDEAAMQAVKRWRFSPARVGEETVSSEVEVPVRFALSE